MKLINHIKKSLNVYALCRLSSVVSKFHCPHLIIFFLWIIAVGCSDDFDSKSGIENQIRGYVKVNFTIPESEHIITRANIGEKDDASGERNINSLTILVFDKEGSKILQREDLPSEKLSEIRANNNEDGLSGSNSFSYQFKSDKINSESKIYAIANARLQNGNDILGNFNTDDQKSIEDLEDVVHSSYYDGENPYGLFMAGQGSFNADFTISIDLKRTAAKITLQDKSNNPNFVLDKKEAYKAINTSNNCYLIASLTNKIYPDNSANPIIPNEIPYNDTFRYDAFVSPTTTYTGSVEESNIEIKSYILIKGRYNGETTFYAVSLRDRDSEGKIIGYYNILPNYWYEMELTGVKGPGYPNEADALAHIDSDVITVAIHDHASGILSMISDGVRELGVTSFLNFDTQKEFTVKLYSAIAGEVTEETKPESVTITEGNDWLRLIANTGQNPNPMLISSNEEISGNQDEDIDHPGVRWKYKLELINEDNIMSDRKATINVKWKGLEREIKVIYHTEFKASDFCFSTLTIWDKQYIEDPQKESDYFARIDYYWDFVAGNGESPVYEYTEGNPTSPPTIEGIPRMYGTRTLVNNNVRNAGFHFPMPYKSPDSRDMSYTYRLNFDVLEGGWTAKDISNIEINHKGAFFEKYLKTKYVIEKSSEDIVYLWMDKVSDEDRYKYAIGEITFKVIFTSGEISTLTTQLYHTGFFHYMGNMYSGSNQNGYGYADYSDWGYYYYEVIEMEGAHWLDRNVAAKSNKMLVNNSFSQNDYLGDTEAAGLFYTIANSGTNQTQIKIDDQMCPPGYTIPNSTEWNSLLISSRFKSSHIILDNTSILATYYESENPEIGKIYFPRTGYYNSQSNNAKYINFNEINSGDAGKGYYWSVSPAEDLENDQTGNFLKVLNINDASSTFINGNISESKMNVRCIAESDHNVLEKKYSIDFNVKGATHVYLYTENLDGTKNGVFSFPGKTVGSQSAVDGLIYDDDNSFIHFSYTSIIPADKLKVLFTYVTDNGQINVISRNGEKSLDKATGWEVVVGENYFFDLSHNPIKVPNI